MTSDRIVLIKKYFDELERIDKEEKDTKTRFFAKSMLLFSIINSSISLAEDVISRKNLQIPGNYYEIFDILQNNRVIRARLSEDMKLLVRLRNILAHEYETFDEKKIANLATKIESVKEFVKIVAKMAGDKRQI